MSLITGKCGLITTDCVCGGQKKRTQSFCGSCYYKLPPKLRKDLYQRIGEGYEEAHAEAIRILKSEAAK